MQIHAGRPGERFRWGQQNRHERLQPGQTSLQAFAHGLLGQVLQLRVDEYGIGRDLAQAAVQPGVEQHEAQQFGDRLDLARARKGMELAGEFFHFRRQVL